MPKKPEKVIVFYVSPVEDGRPSFWSVTSEDEYQESFEIGGIFKGRQKAITFASEQAQNHKALMEDYSFLVILEDDEIHGVIKRVP